MSTDNTASRFPYLFWALILSLFSVAGLFLLYRQYILPKTIITDSSSPDVELIESNDELIETPIPSVPETISPQSTQIPQPTQTPLPTPTPTHLDFVSDIDQFSVSYSSDRKIYQDTEATGRRYSFYHSQNNIVVHTGSQWSWQHPARNFTDTLLVSNLPTFRYDTDTQTIVDIQLGDRLYTIQCVHNNYEIYKNQCNDFLKSLIITPSSS